MTKSLTAAELVKLAKCAAETYVRRGRRRPDYVGFILYVWDDYDARLGTPDSHTGYVLSATLTPEVLASEEALTRALLASAVTIDADADEGEPESWLAWVGDQREPDTHFVSGPSREMALNGLLDALLSEAPQ